MLKMMPSTNPTMAPMPVDGLLRRLLHGLLVDGLGLRLLRCCLLRLRHWLLLAGRLRLHGLLHGRLSLLCGLSRGLLRVCLGVLVGHGRSFR